ncbi:RDD family protein [Sessilibacter corallicola]|uniref:RDD family protein n=1 Tax=Sessilibacter corallicola TaxID=2904075 RepID=UPI001E441FB2|nr:RDD family protein [Sessilibacter corallicola]MCE2029486.1 RDD family protein [Sessilibacter corallicola]
MESDPDYSDYSLDELLDAQSHIDSQKYPERAKSIELAISVKINDSEFKDKLKLQKEEEKYFTFAPRLFAAVVDSLLISILSAVLTYVITLSDGGLRTIIGYVDIIQFAAYSIALHTLYGQTLGKMLTGVKVVTLESETAISFKHAFLRDCVPIVMLVVLIMVSVFIPVGAENQTPEWLLYTMSILGIAYLIWHFLEIVTMLFNDKNRALHDFIAGTVVVRV